VVAARPPAVTNPLWVFSLSVYAWPGVAEACLALQDRHGLEVNFLLAALWLADLGHDLAQDELAHLERETSPLRDRVREARTVRRRMDRASIEYRECKQRELALEANLQDVIYAHLVMHHGGSERLERRRDGAGVGFEARAWNALRRVAQVPDPDPRHASARHALRALLEAVCAGYARRGGGTAVS